MDGRSYALHAVPEADGAKAEGRGGERKATTLRRFPR